MNNLTNTYFTQLFEFVKLMQHNYRSFPVYSSLQGIRKKIEECPQLYHSQFHFLLAVSNQKIEGRHF